VHEQQASMKNIFDLGIWGGNEGAEHELGVVARCRAWVGRNWEVRHTPGRMAKFRAHRRMRNSRNFNEISLNFVSRIKPSDDFNHAKFLVINKRSTKRLI
jgi:hypothetical protein